MPHKIGYVYGILSAEPNKRKPPKRNGDGDFSLVRPAGLEPATYGLEVRKAISAKVNSNASLLILVPERRDSDGVNMYVSVTGNMR